MQPRDAEIRTRRAVASRRSTGSTATQAAAGSSSSTGPASERGKASGWMGWAANRGVQPPAARRHRNQLRHLCRRRQRPVDVRYCITLDSHSAAPTRHASGRDHHAPAQPGGVRFGRAGHRRLLFSSRASASRIRARQVRSSARLFAGTQASTHTPRRCPTRTRTCSVKAFSPARALRC
jgi:hypothetical protein